MERARIDGKALREHAPANNHGMRTHRECVRDYVCAVTDVDVTEISECQNTTWRCAVQASPSLYVEHSLPCLCAWVSVMSRHTRIHTSAYDNAV
jgi:hypothetical protein